MEIEGERWREIEIEIEDEGEGVVGWKANKGDKL